MSVMREIKYWLVLIFFVIMGWLLGIQFAKGQTYTEFYCQTTADNLNAGSTKEDSANQTYAGGTFVRATGVFTVASGNPSTDTGVTNGAWASIYTTSGATIANCVGRITNTSASTLIIDIGTVSGATANVSETAAAATAKVGGAWKGPNAAVALPVGFIATNSINGSGKFPRVNLKNGVNYAITAAMTHSLHGPITFQGYTSSVGDGGKATIDGGTSGASYVLLTASGTCLIFKDLIFSNNGTTSAAQNLITAIGSGQLWQRCIFHDARALGIAVANSMLVDNCEAYACNKGNGSALGAFKTSTAAAIVKNCIAHDNVGGVNAHGFAWGLGVMLNCISYNNSGVGFYIAGTASVPEPIIIQGCDSYSNALAGVTLAITVPAVLEFLNCNFVKNAGMGITNSSLANHIGEIKNCGFGTGTMTNLMGNVDPQLIGVYTNSLILYASGVTPWVDPANGNFSINLTAAKSAGFGAFPLSTSAYPDIGAAQSASTNAAVSGGSWTFAQ